MLILNLIIYILIFDIFFSSSSKYLWQRCRTQNSKDLHGKCKVCAFFLILVNKMLTLNFFEIKILKGWFNLEMVHRYIKSNMTSFYCWCFNIKFVNSLNVNKEIKQ